MTTAPLTLCVLDESPVDGLDSLSPFCLKAHRALHLSGLPYRVARADRPDAHRAHNPTGQVPVLLVGDRAVPDSTAILAELMRLAPGALDRGLDARSLAEAWLWEELADAALNGFLVAARWADDDNWPAVRDAYFAAMPGPVRAVVPALLRRRVLASLVARDVWRAGPEACWRRYGDLLDRLEARAPREGFWLGERATFADVALFAQLQGLRNGLTAKQRDWIAARPRLAAWLDRVDLATRAPAK